tara:strand:- start:64657 stop:65694 length:1038 start_codon:yes stop_codon:yes gene_type:complete
MKTSFKQILGIAAVSLSITVTTFSTGASASNISLVYASESPPQTFPVVTANKWANEVKERTDGRVSVRVFSGGSLLTAGNMYDGVSSGVADIGSIAVSYDPGRFPLLSLAGAVTGLEVSSAVASQAVYDLTREFTAEQLGFKDFKILTAFTSEPGRIHSRNQVRNLEELKGLELRVPGDTGIILRQLGAVPVGLSMPETGEALQTGVISGYVGSRETLMDLKFARTTKYVADYPLTNVVFVVAMRKDRWDSLPEDVQAILEELGAQTALYAGSYLDGRVAESLKWSAIEEDVQVVSLSEEETRRWDEQLQPLLDARVADVEAKGLPAKQLVEKLHERIKAYRATE